MKLKGLHLLLNCIFVIVFNVVVFMIFQTFTVTFWVAYGFIHVAYLMAVISSYVRPKGRSSAVLGYPLASISWTYFLVEFVLGTMFLIFKDASFKISFIPQFVLFGIYVSLFISNILANRATSDEERQGSQNNLYIKQAASEVNLMMNQAADAALRKKLERIYDSLMGSQIRSNPALRDIENKIMINIGNLRESVRENNYIKANSAIVTLQGLIDDRNSRISLGRL
jgi:hypothetical protein